jgi:hypothetical protein
MNENMRNLVILLCGIACALILIIILFAGKSPFMKFISIFLEEREDEPEDGEERVNSSGAKQRSKEGTQKNTSEPLVEMATLIRKSDDRLRVIESTGQVKMIDEYYELVFVTRKGKTLKIECSRNAYEKVPFNQQGSLTYKRGRLVKFKYYEDTVYNN